MQSRAGEEQRAPCMRLKMTEKTFGRSVSGYDYYGWNAIDAWGHVGDCQTGESRSESQERIGTVCYKQRKSCLALFPETWPTIYTTKQKSMA
ncbi:uncharacterized [Tachysurus ichikawai]